MIDKEKLPKVLIVSRGTWNDAKGTSSTLSNLFRNYDPEKLAHIYIESKLPSTNCCHKFFQISEFSLIYKLFRWNQKTGHVIDKKANQKNPTEEKIASQEEKTMSYVRGHRSYFYSFLRNILWSFNGWKSNDLRQFVQDFSPNVIWLDGSPLPFMYKIYDHILKVATCPASIFMQDDVYTYKSCNSFISKIRKFGLRKKVMHTTKLCCNMFVASPKMKIEYDEIFGVDSTFIAKSIEYANNDNHIHELHHPIKMVYLGQVIYGRIYSLIAIAEALKIINENGCKLQLSIYTNNYISNDLKEKLLVSPDVNLLPPVPYSEVPKIVNDSDVVVFVESFYPKYRNVARLSFSTKISDYLASGKCIFAVGPDDSAPIEYFNNEDAALVSTDISDIKNVLLKLTNTDLVTEYAHKARLCGIKNHDKNAMDERVFGKLMEISKK